MKVNRIVVGYLECNCYIVDNGNNSIIIDPGDDYDKILESIGGRNVIGIIITHGHFDHVGCVDDLVRDYNILVYSKDNMNEGINRIGNFEFRCIYTPGHTDDSICIYFEKDKIMFTGDFLFRGSIGRTDLGGNDRDIYNSINKIKKYDDDIIIYPGHGDSSTLGFEKKYNPFF